MSATPAYVSYDSDIAPAAALIGDPTRAAMLTALLDRRALAAGELARLAGVSPATASAHLTRLLDGNLVAVLAQGRHRYYRLAGPEVAHVVESLAHVSPPMQARGLRQSRQAAALGELRTCYDHLAGRVAVAFLGALRDGGILVAEGDAFRVTGHGEGVLTDVGIDVAAARRSRRTFAGPCLDSTERRPHLNGALGAALATRMLDLGWVVRGQQRRVLRLTDTGRTGLVGIFGFDPADGDHIGPDKRSP